MDEDWVKKLLTIMIGSIVLFTILICQTQEIAVSYTHLAASG